MFKKLLLLYNKPQQLKLKPLHNTITELGLELQLDSCNLIIKKLPYSSNDYIFTVWYISNGIPINQGEFIKYHNIAFYNCEYLCKLFNINFYNDNDVVQTKGLTYDFANISYQYRFDCYINITLTEDDLQVYAVD